MSEPRMSPAPALPECAAVLLAAGKSTRMRSRTPKPLHPLCGLPLTRHVVEACRGAGIARTVVVVGHEAQRVRAGLGIDVEYALQAEQRGSGDAVRAAEETLRGFDGAILVLAGDVPLLRAETLTRLLSHHQTTGAAATLLTAHLPDATGYGRIVRAADGSVLRIVEEKDATPAERALTEWNPSLYCFRADALWNALRDVRPNNAQGEYYLTDVIGILTAGGARVEALATDDVREVLGVNTRVELAQVTQTLRERLLRDLMLSGVTITDPATTYVDVSVTVGIDTVIEPHTFLLAGTRIGEECVIGPYSRIVMSEIGDRTAVLASQVVESVLGDDVKVGPYAHIRPHCRLANGVKIGDFVELKNATLGEKVSASHLAYLGDAEVGARTNIGAGVITCNYDGQKKHRTTIGEGAFIGTNATLIAPVTIGDGAYIAAASPMPEDVPADALAIARERPTIKPDWARKKREQG